jgi:hypothetical protein
MCFEQTATDFLGVHAGPHCGRLVFGGRLSIARRLAIASVVEAVAITTEIGSHTERGANHALKNAMALLPADGMAVAKRTFVFATESQSQPRKESGVKMVVRSLVVHGLRPHIRSRKIDRSKDW